MTTTRTKLAFGAGTCSGGDVGEQDLAHERGVAVGIEKIEGAMTVDPEVVVVGVDRDAEGLLNAGMSNDVLPAVGDADLAESVVHRESRWRGHLDVGPMEGDHLVVPVRRFGEVRGRSCGGRHGS